MQGYWNYKNYLTGKKQLIAEVQNSIDNAVEDYFTDLAKENLIGFTLNDSIVNGDFTKLDSIVSAYDRIDSLANKNNQNVHIKIDITDEGESKLKIFTQDSIKNQSTFFKTINATDSLKSSLTKWRFESDSLFNNPLAKLTSRVIFRLSDEVVDLKRVDTLFTLELQRKEINVQHQLELNNTSANHNKKIRIPKEFDSDKEILTTFSKTGVLPKNTEIAAHFSNVTGTILKRMRIGLFLSFLFSLAIILSLLYLLKVIKTQKQLAEIKNDLISNITHEFKTPIATIGAAMEGIKTFNTENDLEKTLKYANISAVQVTKLNGMVEKILETAALDSESLRLNFEETDLVHLLETIATKELFNLPDKTITFHTTETSFTHLIDRFHFENAINNLVDNAIKYGGKQIELKLTKQQEKVLITIKDNGTELTTAQGQQIFDKFYRVPKGNTHDVKGFGIGLFYTKAIIEKHQGTIALTVKPTTFNITLPL